MRKCIYAVIGCLFVWACKTGQKEGAWFEETKARIIAESDKMHDSIAPGVWAGTNKPTRNYFINGQKFKTEILREPAVPVGLTFYHHKFELRREYCLNGNLLFEGIVYEGDFYGLSTWWHCNGKIMQQGVKFKSKKIGIWKTWDTAGKLVETKNFGREDLIDSLQLIE